MAPLFNGYFGAGLSLYHNVTFPDTVDGGIRAGILAIDIGCHQYHKSNDNSRDKKIFS
jgi:hypothetical protein